MSDKKPIEARLEATEAPDTASFNLTLLEKSPYSVPDPTRDPPVRNRDLAMGQFMDAWSRVEWGLRNLLQMLAQAPSDAAASIAHAIPDNGRMIELLEVLGDIYLGSDDLKELTEIAQKLKGYNRLRNSIVHGHWGLTNNRDKTITDGVIHDMMWIRVYNLIDQRLVFNAALGRDEKAYNQYVFTVARLRERAQKSAAVAERLEVFSQRIKGRIGIPKTES